MISMIFYDFLFAGETLRLPFVSQRFSGGKPFSADRTTFIFTITGMPSAKEYASADRARPCCPFCRRR